MIYVLGALAFVVIFTLVASADTSGGTGTMQALSRDQIRQFASDAGFAGTDLDTAVAIAIAESSGVPDAKGDLALGGSVGLWQIYTVAHPQWALQDLTDPAVNAAAAYDIYTRAGNSFHPWSTYNHDKKGNRVGDGNGVYLSYLGQTGGAGGSY